jgi:hypothetical protein
MSHDGSIHVFGVRHLSPGGAWHLRQFLDRIRPKLVLIEGLADADELIPHIVRKDTKPPIAILAYTDTLPVRTLVYPLARYSPEYQALAWAKANRAATAFIDLPSAVFLGLADREEARWQAARKQAAEETAAELEKPATEKQPTEQQPAATSLPQAAPPPRRPEREASLYERIARIAGEPDHETYWERHFEHNLSEDSYRRAAYEYGMSLRELDSATREWRAENLVREAYMRKRIAQYIAEGIRPDQIVAVVGAFHASVLQANLPPMTDDEFHSLPQRAGKLTLMPYSYYKLSSQSGYGAGNQAPAYFEMLWEGMVQGEADQVPTRYLSRIARQVREAGTHRSTAEVIEGVRLAATMSALYGGLAPTLRDLRESAITLLGHGEIAPVKEAVVQVEVGHEIGSLPDGVSRTSIQTDFERELVRLKLEKYKTQTAQDLAIDLRENRQAKTEEAAFLDLHRSGFLHRLRVLGVSFCEPLSSGQKSTNWAERWRLKWTPESEIQLVEAVLLGETVELAVGYKFKTILEECQSIAAAGDVIHDACLCGLMKAMEAARVRLQELAAGSYDFAAIAHAAHRLGQTVRYGDVRKFDPEPLVPLVEELFLQGTLSLHGSAGCDDAAAKGLRIAMDELNAVALEFSDRVNEPLWFEALRRLSDADDRNPLLSGYACAILLERGLMGNEELVREVSRRLSPGVPADLGAGWFQGLSLRNRYALLARQTLWAQLADYVASLEENEFRRAVVFLRRAFGSFGKREKRQIAENLAEHWGVHGDQTAALLETPLTEAEEAKLEELNDFDFGDL